MSELTGQATLEACLTSEVIPSEIPDPSYQEPEGWDEEEDGEFIVPLMPNPVCKDDVPCGDHTPLKMCLLGFVPHILDSGAAGREEALAVLKAAATKEQRRSSQTYAVGWAEGGKQMELQQALGVGEYDYPVVVVLSQKKKLFARLVGSFTERSIGTFLERTTLGQEQLSPFKDLSVADAEAWDGKDGEVIEEEPLEDLEELMGAGKEDL